MEQQSSSDILVRGFSLSFEGREIFHNFNLILESGKWNALLGRSGVGKSSLLKAIAGLLPPESYQGQITTASGADLWGNISWMTQDDLLLPWLSVLDNVLIANKLRGQTVGHQRIEPSSAIKLLEELGLGPSLQVKPNALSGGMRQRTALARTLLEDRPIVLLDEPFSALDAITREEMQKLTHRYLASKTVVMITHDPLEALKLAHNIFVLKGPEVTFTKVIKPKSDPFRDIKSLELIEAYENIMSLLSDQEKAS